MNDIVPHHHRRPSGQGSGDLRCRDQHDQGPRPWRGLSWQPRRDGLHHGIYRIEGILRTA